MVLAAEHTERGNLDTEGSESEVRPRSRGGIALSFTALGIATICFNQYRVGDWVISDLILGFATGAAVLALLTSRTSQLSKKSSGSLSPIFVLGITLLIIGSTLSSIVARYPLVSINAVAKIIAVSVIWLWLLKIVVSDRHAVGRIVRAFKFTILVSAGAATLGSFHIVDLGAIDNNRQTAFFHHPNQLATCLVAGLPFFLLSIPTSGSKRGGLGTIVRFVAIGLVIFALASTGSMMGASGAIIAATITLSLFALTRHPQTRRAHPLRTISIIALFAFGLAFLAQSNAQVVERFTLWRSGDSGTSSSVESRGEFSEAVLERFDERLVLGIGLRGVNDLELEDVGGQNHNMYLAFLNSAGLPAVIGLILALSIVVHHGWRLSFATRGTPLHMPTMAATGATVGMMYINLFNPASYERYFWFPILLLLVIWQVRRQELRADAARSEHQLPNPRSRVGPPRPLDRASRAW